MNVIERKRSVRRNGLHVGHGPATRIHHDERRFARHAQHQQRLGIAEHVAEQMRLLANQIAHVHVLHQRADLVDPRDERPVVAHDQLRFELAIQREADNRHRAEREQRKQQREARGERDSLHASCSQR
jgi:hypothetical protein